MRGSNGRLVTWIAVALVLGIGALAAVDAVRAREEPADPPQARERPATRFAALAGELRAAGVAGTLAYIDASCRLHTIAFPALRELDVGPLPSCRLAPAFTPPRELPISAAASAVGPDGTVAFIRNGDVAVWPFGCLEGAASPCVRTVLPRTTIARDFDAATTRDIGIEGLASLGGERVATVVRVESADSERTMIAVFEGGRLVGTVPWFASEAVRLTVSPRGEYVAVEAHRPSRLFLLDREGDVGVLADVARNWFGRTSLQGARAIAWSPDERWTALAKNESVYVFTTRDGDDAYLVRLPIAARDLAWY